MTAEAGTFDYIIAGAGSAGCAVAARLSESGRYRVLLLEAGADDRNPWIHVPMGYARLFADPRLNWMYESEPEAELEGRTLYQPRGKVLGGTSSINGMVYMRGNAADYDEWRQRGCTGWDYDNVLPYFKKAEDQERGADTFHGVGGPLKVSDQAVRWELAEHWIAAAVETGLPANPDFNGARQDGAGPFQSTTSDRRRWSAAAAYLRPARRRPNLAVRTGALALRLLFEGRRAAGIEFSSGGRLFQARARGEIVVCGGVYNSPQLLQLSGIGPAALLHELGIAVIADIPAVGEHLQDHFYVRLAFRCKKPITMNEIANSPWRRTVAAARYFLCRSGPFSSNGVCAGAFARSDPRLERPDLQLNLSMWSFADRGRAGVKPHPFPGFSVSAVHLRPDGRGSVRLTSPNPLAPPAIRFNFLRTRYDFAALTTGMRLARQIARQPALADYVAAETLPGPAVESDADFVAAIRRHGLSNLHPVGTCRMGGAVEGSVVDPRLRVYGIGGLRVVDASIMPSVPAGNTNAPTIMIAEKASAMILEDARAAA
ncbi:MAG: GMC family oxidoreductase [Stellaceae bacterium]